MGASTDTAAFPTLDLPSTGTPVGEAKWRVVKLVAAIFLLPFCIELAVAAYDYFNGLGLQIRVALFGWPKGLVWFSSGVTGFAVLAIFIWRPISVYLLAHELTHGLATWICLGRVSNLRGSLKGGKLSSSKSNTFIRLAPYCIPLYALVFYVAFWGIHAWWRPLSEYHAVYSSVLGFCMAFHIGFSLWSLRRDQPDIQVDGWFFSLMIIFLVNIIVLSAVLSVVFGGSFGDVASAVGPICSKGFDNAIEVYRNILRTITGWA